MIPTTPHRSPGRQAYQVYAPSAVIRLMIAGSLGMDTALSVNGKAVRVVEKPKDGSRGSG